MSQSYAAFFKLEIEDLDLLDWLDVRPSPASRWDDWRALGGVSGGASLAELSDAELAALIARCDNVLMNAPSNRALLEGVIAMSDDPSHAIAGFDRAGRIFVGGSLTYSSDLVDCVAFLALARGAADLLRPDRFGVALLHDYLGDAKNPTLGALQMSPGASAFLVPEQAESASAAFVDLVEPMLAGAETPEFSPRVQLDALG